MKLTTNATYTDNRTNATVTITKIDSKTKSVFYRIEGEDKDRVTSSASFRKYFTDLAEAAAAIVKEADAATESEATEAPAAKKEAPKTKTAKTKAPATEPKTAEKAPKPVKMTTEAVAEFLTAAGLENARATRNGAAVAGDVKKVRVLEVYHLPRQNAFKVAIMNTSRMAGLNDGITDVLKSGCWTVVAKAEELPTVLGKVKANADRILEARAKAKDAKSEDKPEADQTAAENIEA